MISSNDIFCRRNNIFSKSKANKQMTRPGTAGRNQWHHKMASACWAKRAPTAWVSRTNKLCEDLALKKTENYTESSADIPKIFFSEEEPLEDHGALCAIQQDFLWGSIHVLNLSSTLAPQTCILLSKYFNDFFYKWYSLVFPLFWGFLGNKSGPFSLLNLPLPSSSHRLFYSCRIILYFLPRMPLLTLLSDIPIFQSLLQTVPGLCRSSLIGSGRWWPPSLQPPMALRKHFFYNATVCWNCVYIPVSLPRW